MAIEDPGPRATMMNQGDSIGHGGSGVSVSNGRELPP